MKQIAFVTGGNKGIGFAIARHLGLNGWQVIIGARQEQRAQEAISRLEADGITVGGWVSIELTDPESVSRAVAEIGNTHPGISLLVNNAGIPGDMSVRSWDTTVDDIRQTLEVNFVGTFALTKALVPLLRQNHGRIVNITVPSEVSPYWHPLAYVASKAAQNAMTAVMATDFVQTDSPIETYSIHPGPTTTDLNGNMALPGFHDADTVGRKVAEIVDDGQSHQGEFIELYPIVKED